MTLSRYKLKRDFSKSPEPRARVAKSRGKPIFVVQEHHASRLHYDFRLEAEGVLKSWAVPREPTLDPSTKRLAVRVEDHPLQYASFSGTIPTGEYGAGKVSIWDKGTYDNLMAAKARPQTVTEGIENGKVEVLLSGQKLKGRFALVRLKDGKKDNWLLIKMKDDQARTETSKKSRSTPKVAIRSAKAAIPKTRKLRSLKTD